MPKDKPPPRPAPRLYLATPVVADPSNLAGEIAGILAGVDVAAVLVRLAPADPRTLVERAKLLVPPIQHHGAAVLIEDHVEVVARCGADGAHVTGIEAMREAFPPLKPDRILGVGGLATRHDSMTAGEAGADYVLFGEPDKRRQRPGSQAIAERIDWWAELFEPPCVGYAASYEEAVAFAEAGADFVLAGDFVWDDARGPRAALLDMANGLKGAATALRRAGA